MKLTAALKTDRLGTLRAIQAALTIDADRACEAMPTLDFHEYAAVIEALESLAVALEGGSAAPAVTRTGLFCGDAVTFCGSECAYHYDERCPDKAHVDEASHDELPNNRRF